MESYGRRLCVRVDGAPTVDNEASDEVLEKVKTLIKETSCVNPDVVIDRDHQMERTIIIKKQMFLLKLLLYVLQFLGTEQCFIGIELI